MLDCTANEETYAQTSLECFIDVRGVLCGCKFKYNYNGGIVVNHLFEIIVSAHLNRSKIIKPIIIFIKSNLRM